MTRPSRRDILRALAAAGGTLWAGACAGSSSRPRTGIRSARAGARAEPARGGPRHHIVRITLDGGFDSVMTVDPKEPRTAGDVEMVYHASDRLRGERRLFGPLIGGLLRHDRKLCLVHGVRHDTVAHDTGEGILRAGRKRFSGGTRPFGDLAGELLPGTAPIQHLHIQTGQPEPFSEDLDLVLLPGNPAGRELPMAGQVEVDAGTIARLYRASEPAPFRLPTWFDELEQVSREEARELLGGDADKVAAYEASQKLAADTSRLLATAERRTSLRASALGPGLALALHAIRADHARFITVRSPRAWLDTHTDNVALQKARTVPLLDDIAGFIDELTADGEDGALLDRTTVVIHSELGRFPKLNVARGKDHWPENSWILLGRGIRPGLTVGATDKQFRGVPIGYSDGSPDAADRRPLDADALFATVLRIAGADPARHDYERDAVVQCLMAKER
jgi:hypothetical protein